MRGPRSTRSQTRECGMIPAKEHFSLSSLHEKQSFCSPWYWVTKTASGGSVIEMPPDVHQLYQKAPMLGKGHVVSGPVAQRRSAMPSTTRIRDDGYRRGRRPRNAKRL